MNISATQVLLQSNFFASGTSIASRTAWRLAPQNVQNLMSSFWFEAQRGHSIGSSCSGISMDTTILRPEFQFQKSSTMGIPQDEAPAGQNNRALPDRRNDRRRGHGRGLQSLREQTPARTRAY